jgi:hypothetical protein
VSKFGDLRKNRASEPVAPAIEVAPPPIPSPAPPKPAGPGSRGGKRDDPAFTQATCYLPATLLHKVKGRLHEERGAGGKGRDFSDLVKELLEGWASSPRT